MDILRLPKKSIAYLENPAVPLLFYFLTLFTAICTRNFLDVFSDTATLTFKMLPATHPLFFPTYAGLLISLWYFTLFWTTLLLLFPIVMALITKEPIDKTLRVILGFSWIIVITPLVDLFLSGGKGIEATFIKPDSFLSMLPFPAALNPGEKVTVAVGTLLIFIYGIVKTSKTAKALLGAALFYGACLVSFVLPSAIERSGQLIIKDFKLTSPVDIIAVLAGLLFIESAAIFFLYKKASLVALLKKMDALKTIHLVFIFLLGALVARSHITAYLLNNLGTCALNLMVLVSAWAVIAILATPREENTGFIPAILIGLIAIVCAAALSMITVFLLVAALGCAFVYYQPPLRLKRVPFLSKILLSACLVLVLMLGWLFAGGDLFRFPHILTFYTLVFGTACLAIIDLAPARADETDIKTLPVILGEKRAHLYVAVIFLISYLLVPLLFLERGLFFPSLLLGIIQGILIYRKNYHAPLVLAVHLVGFLGILTWFNSLRFSP